MELSEGVNTTHSDMNKKIATKVEMYERVLGILEENEVNWIDKPAYVSAWSSFTDNLASIKLHIEQKENPITGTSMQKQKAREVLVASIYNASSLIKAFALAQNNQELLVRNKVSRSKLKIMREADFEQHVIRVLKDINSHLSDLSDYGITVTEKDALTASFNKWKALKIAPRKAINDRKKEGFTIQQLIQWGDKLLRSTLDELMVPFEKTHPTFHFDYRSARMLLSARGRNDDVTPSTSDPF